MALDSDHFRLMRKSLTALSLGLATVVVCYFSLDRQVAFFVYNHQINDVQIFRWLTFPPPIVQAWTPVVIALLMLIRVRQPFTRWQLALFGACVSLILADQFRTSLGEVCGRYWPETWFDHNRSLIGTGTYGFHPFRSDDDVGSFPSGHAARILGFAGVWWIAYPGIRWLLVVLCLPMLLSLIAMDYHFVSDVIAGGVMGGIVAAYTALLTGDSPGPRQGDRGP